MATKPDTTAPARPASTARIIDLNEARRVALLRRLWAEHDGEGRAI